MNNLQLINKNGIFYEYFCAFGLLMTLVWLYLEILRLVQMILAFMGDDN